jgi:hypothetical protein
VDAAAASFGSPPDTSLRSAPATDLRGIPRPRDGVADGSADFDVGARENEGVTRLVFDGPTSLAWDPSIDPWVGFNVYRGDLQVLRDTGVYVQDPVAVMAARRWCGLASPQETDTDDPQTGQTMFYLAVVQSTVEGSLGYDGTPTERPFDHSNRCP